MLLDIHQPMQATVSEKCCLSVLCCEGNWNRLLRLLWDLHPWRYSKDIWTQFWALCSRLPCLSRKGGLRLSPEVPSNHNHSVILDLQLEISPEIFLSIPDCGRWKWSLVYPVSPCSLMEMFFFFLLYDSCVPHFNILIRVVSYRGWTAVIVICWNIILRQ